MRDWNWGLIGLGALIIGGIVFVIYGSVQIVRCDAACRALGHNRSTAYVDGRCGCDSHESVVEP